MTSLGGGARRQVVADGEQNESDTWCTGRELARLLGHWSTDPCSNPRSHIQADEHFSLENGQDGLLSPWGWSVFWNGPYSKPLPWCVRLAQHSGPWCALVKLDPTTTWWETLMSAHDGWAPFKDRLKFERPDKPPLTANFASALIWHQWWPSRALASLLWLPRYA